jgi:hypothetical protein
LWRLKPPDSCSATSFLLSTQFPQSLVTIWPAEVHQLSYQMSVLSKYKVSDFVSTFQFQLPERMTLSYFDNENYFMIQEHTEIFSDPEKPIFTI